MGYIVNTANDIGVTISKNASVGVTHGAQCPLHMVKKTDGMDKLGRSMTSQLEKGLKMSNVTSEDAGVAMGDLSKTTKHAGVLGLYALIGSSLQTKVALNSATNSMLFASMAAVSMSAGPQKAFSNSG